MGDVAITDEAVLAEIVRAMRTVIVIGAKESPGEPAHDIPQLLQRRGVRVIPVNPKFAEVVGERCWPSVADVPERADVIDVFRRAELMLGHAREILALPAERRPDVVWMQSGIVSDEAAELLAAAGIRVVMDHCLGVYASKYRRRS